MVVMIVIIYIYVSKSIYIYVSKSIYICIEITRYRMQIEIDDVIDV